MKSEQLPNITDLNNVPDFSGRIRYTCTFDRPGTFTGIDLGEVGQTSHVWCNGIDLGIRVCSPYRYDLEKVLKDTDNTLVIEVSNTLANAIRDRFTGHLAIPASGLIGTVNWIE